MMALPDHGTQPRRPSHEGPWAFGNHLFANPVRRRLFPEQPVGRASDSIGGTLRNRPFVRFVGAQTGSRDNRPRWRECDEGFCRFLLRPGTGEAFTHPRSIIYSSGRISSRQRIASCRGGACQPSKESLGSFRVAGGACWEYQSIELPRDNQPIH